ncbi:MAG: trypsin-like peptidase domain-containing protein [Phycisphaerae bacterium]
MSTGLGMGSTLAVVLAAGVIGAAVPLRAAEPAPSIVPAEVRAAESRRIEVMARAARSVVCIFGEARTGGGSGVVITPDGYGLTNFHVVAEMMDTRKGLGGLSDGKLYPLQVLGIDPTGDLAMFRLSGREAFEPAPLGDSDLVRVGDWVFAMGNPFLLAEDYSPTATHGIVSGVHRYQFGADNRSLVYTDCIQVDASINPGNSGGPLFNMSGEVIGINGRASFEVRGRVNVGAGYAISINQVRRFIPALRAGLLAEHGSLGATTLDLGYRKVVFEKMLEPSVASAVGIGVGDRLVRFGGVEIHSSNQFANHLGVYPANWPVLVEYRRGQQQEARIVRLERLPVRLPQPYEVDEEINAAETRRVLEACVRALGKVPIEGTLSWRAVRQAFDQTAGEAEVLEFKEGADGRGECAVLDRAARPAARYEYNGRVALAAGADGKMSDAGALQADRLNLFMNARRALYAPLTDERLKRWRHVGGDELDGRVLDMLEYQPGDSPEVRVSIDPATHEPVRIMWRPLDAPSKERPAVEMVLGAFRPVGGTRLPHRIELHASGRRVSTDTVQSYKVEAQP